MLIYFPLTITWALSCSACMRSRSSSRSRISYSPRILRCSRASSVLQIQTFLNIAAVLRGSVQPSRRALLGGEFRKALMNCFFPARSSSRGQDTVPPQAPSETETVQLVGLVCPTE